MPCSEVVLKIILYNGTLHVFTCYKVLSTVVMIFVTCGADLENLTAARRQPEISLIRQETPFRCFNLALFSCWSGRYAPPFVHLFSREILLWERDKIWKWREYSVKNSERVFFSGCARGNCGERSGTSVLESDVGRHHPFKPKFDQNPSWWPMSSKISHL
jgi:hypothetical protein